MTIIDPCKDIVFNKLPIPDFTYFITDFAVLTPYGPWTTTIPACEPLTYTVTYGDGITPLTYPLSFNSITKTIRTYTNDPLFAETLYTI